MHSKCLLTPQNLTMPDKTSAEKSCESALVTKDRELKRLSSELADLHVKYKQLLADKNLESELAAKDREIERLTMRVSGSWTC